jgi:hypothetical protein
MIMRAAVLSDQKGLVDLALSQAVAIYPNFTPELEKITDLVREAITSRQYFAVVIERDGVIVSALLANSCPHGWARKSVSQIMLWVSGQRGDGRAMLRAYMEWVESRPIIRMAGMFVDYAAPEWLPDFMVSEGFTHSGGALQWFRG